MISNDKLNNIVKACESAGHKITVKDISYVLLCREYDDIAVAYKCLYSIDVINTEIINYHKSEAITFLRNYMDSNFARVNLSAAKKGKGKNSDITFEENKEYMLKLKKQTEEAMANGEIETKDGLKILADISVKLNDKFNIADTTKEQLVVVNVKYNSVCEGCGKELYIPTVEDLKKKYNLIENNNG